VVTFLLAGFVKGVVGLGLPTVSLALLTATLGLAPAMALLLVPSFVTNLWQALAGRHTLKILRRHWLFYFFATAMVWVGALALSRLDPRFLSGLLGLLLVTYASVNLGGIRISVPPQHRAWAGTVLGTANGILTGMTGSFVVPGVMYLQGAGMDRDDLVQAMGILFTLSTFALALALGGNGLIDMELGLLSGLAVVPALAGMVIGQRARGHLPDARFRAALFTALLLMGLSMLPNLLG
jgi:uncharacterized membrane protein YfcA